MSIKNSKWSTIKDLEKRFGVMTLGLFIKAFRQAEDLTQTEYAKQLGLSRANLCDLEKGRKIASPERAAALARKMSVPTEVMLKLAIQDSLREAKLRYRVELIAA